MASRIFSGRVLLVLVPAWIVVGCAAPIPPFPTRSLGAGSTYLVHLPGIAGDTVFDRQWMNALAEGGAADCVQIYDWTCGDGWIDALQAYDRNRGQARRVAAMIAAKLKQDPDAKIVITAESGGTGIAVFALEQLPPGARVDCVLLIAPAISPDYNLTAALRHVRKKLYYFSSRGDWFVLGLGTRVFGTMDGKKTNAAGYVGFGMPAGADPAEYRKLVQMKYDADWIKWGDLGNHTGGMSASFARHFLAPLLVREEFTPVDPEPRPPDARPAGMSLTR